MTNAQPEEWESRFDNAFAHNYLIADEDIIEDVHNRIKSFIKEEIRKAEERAYNQAITDAVIKLSDWNTDDCMVDDIIKTLEALKK